MTAYTPDRLHAGADDSVYLSIIGTKGKTSEHLADNPGNDRERGKEDIYKFTDSADIGEFQCVIARLVGHDGWTVSKVGLYK